MLPTFRAHEAHRAPLIIHGVCSPYLFFAAWHERSIALHHHVDAASPAEAFTDFHPLSQGLNSDDIHDKNEPNKALEPTRAAVTGDYIVSMRITIEVFRAARAAHRWR